MYWFIYFDERWTCLVTNAYVVSLFRLKSSSWLSPSLRNLALNVMVGVCSTFGWQLPLPGSSQITGRVEPFRSFASLCIIAAKWEGKFKQDLTSEAHHPVWPKHYSVSSLSSIPTSTSCLPCPQGQGPKVSPGRVWNCLLPPFILISFLVGAQFRACLFMNWAAHPLCGSRDILASNSRNHLS